jgi:hypothetical protein
MACSITAMPSAHNGFDGGAIPSAPTNTMKGKMMKMSGELKAKIFMTILVLLACLIILGFFVPWILQPVINFVFGGIVAGFLGLIFWAIWFDDGPVYPWE